ncbi:hypothetical protein BSL82_15605 [Tardibacter chloracetimidivorans]|uniref:Uncharacterized protein n=2 Tax=Tardibacter chloracetimidivorans TaxID=1921510 RepID=A0A1L3ZY41_9SPHN|nr:hypothetical protein BSL82_15605 [Tardibacter chloracetimidivorans]
MCFGGGGSKAANRIAKEQRADEVARQARIKDGMAKINAIFDGSSRGINPVTEYDPSKTFYNEDGTPFEPGAANGGNFISLPFGGGFYLGGIPQIAAKTGKLFSGVERTGGFDDAFYDKRRQAYEDYALPQLDQSYDRSKDELIYALDRSGILQSGAAQKKNAELSDEFDKHRLDIANKGLEVANDTRANVENVRSNLVTQLQATGDDQAAAQAAVRQAQNLNQPAGFSPLGQLFAGFADSVSRIGSNARNDYSGFIGGGRSLFSNGGGSARVVG